MKNFVVSYNSPCNLFKGKKLMQGASLIEAQTMFFDWLKTQSVYEHMWSLTIEIEEIK